MPHHLDIAVTYLADRITEDFGPMARLLAHLEYHPHLIILGYPADPPTPLASPLARAMEANLRRHCGRHPFVALIGEKPGTALFYDAEVLHVEQWGNDPNMPLIGGALRNHAILRVGDSAYRFEVIVDHPAAAGSAPTPDRDGCRRLYVTGAERADAAGEHGYVPLWKVAAAEEDTTVDPRPPVVPAADLVPMINKWWWSSGGYQLDSLTHRGKPDGDHATVFTLRIGA